MLLLLHFYVLRQDACGKTQAKRYEKKQRFIAWILYCSSVPRYLLAGQSGLRFRNPNDQFLSERLRLLAEVQVLLGIWHGWHLCHGAARTHGGRVEQHLTAWGKGRGDTPKYLPSWSSTRNFKHFDPQWCSNVQQACWSLKMIINETHRRLTSHIGYVWIPRKPLWFPFFQSHHSTSPSKPSDVSQSTTGAGHYSSWGCSWGCLGPAWHILLRVLAELMSVKFVHNPNWYQNRSDAVDHSPAASPHTNPVKYLSLVPFNGTLAQLSQGHARRRCRGRWKSKGTGEVLRTPDMTRSPPVQRSDGHYGHCDIDLTIWLWLTFLPWKIPMFLIGKPSISIRAIYTMAMLHSQRLHRLTWICPGLVAPNAARLLWPPGSGWSCFHQGATAWQAPRIRGSPGRAMEFVGGWGVLFVMVTVVTPKWLESFWMFFGTWNFMEHPIFRKPPVETSTPLLAAVQCLMIWTSAFSLCHCNIVGYNLVHLFLSWVFDLSACLEGFSCWFVQCLNSFCFCSCCLLRIVRMCWISCMWISSLLFKLVWCYFMRVYVLVWIIFSRRCRHLLIRFICLQFS